MKIQGAHVSLNLCVSHHLRTYSLSFQTDMPPFCIFERMEGGSVSVLTQFRVHNFVDLKNSYPTPALSFIPHMDVLHTIWSRCIFE